MDFRIADTFTDSLTKLAGDEQKAAKTTAFDLQMDPAQPGLQFHKLDRARDPNFWSVRVSRDVRLIVHRTAASLLLCYVDHHDDAYRWAERRKLETHPATGAAQLVEVRETVREITVPRYVEAEQEAPPKPLLFADIPEDELLGYGVPVEWLEDVRLADEDTVLELTDHLPSEAAEALLELATGGTPHVAQPAGTVKDPFEHPDAQRRFRVMNDVEELERALEFPWEKWTIFLHPEQRQLVEKEFGGPARVSGSAGTGKTVVALHRAAYLTRANPDARVLLTTFSDALANSLQTKLRRLISNEPRLGEQLEVSSMDAIGRRLYESNFGKLELASRGVVRQLLEECADDVEGHGFSQHFLLTEWEQVVDAWQLGSWEEYRDVRRLGRKTRLPEQQRRVLWSIFDRVRSGLKNRSLVTKADMFGRLAVRLANSKYPPLDFVVVDEAQDASVAQLSFLSALGGNQPNSLFSRATSARESSSSPSPGRRSASTSAAVPAPCGSTTEPHTRSGRRPTGCWDPRFPTWTASGRNGPVRFLSSMDRHPSFASWTTSKKKEKRSACGYRAGAAKASCHTRWGSLFVLRPSWHGPVRRSRTPVSGSRCSTRTSSLRAGTFRLAQCT